MQPDSKTYEIFSNERLNEIFCPDESEARCFTKTAWETFYKHILSGLERTGSLSLLVASYHAAVLETAFELGWREAMKHVESMARKEARP